MKKSFLSSQDLPNNVIAEFNNQLTGNLGIMNARVPEAAYQVFRVGIRSLGVRRQTPLGKHIRASLHNVGWQVTPRGKIR